METYRTFSDIIYLCQRLHEKSVSQNTLVVRHNLTFIRLCSNGTLPAFQFPTHATEIMAQQKAPIYAMSATGNCVSFITETHPDQLPTLKQQLSRFATFESETDIDVCLIHPEKTSIANQRIIHILNGIRLFNITSCDESLSVAVRHADYPETVRRITAIVFDETHTEKHITHIVQNDFEAFLPDSFHI